MGNWPILSLATFLPLVGAALILLLARGSEAAVAATSRWVALEAMTQALLMKSSDYAEFHAAFKGKRPPEWTGR